MSSICVDCQEPTRRGPKAERCWPCRTLHDAEVDRQRSARRRAAAREAAKRAAAEHAQRVRRCLLERSMNTARFRAPTSSVAAAPLDVVFARQLRRLRYDGVGTIGDQVQGAE